MDRAVITGRHPSHAVARRPRRGLIPAVRPLEHRRLLSEASAVMTQTVTFPNLEAYPTVASQTLLYFNATMGTLTEVDLVTSGSFQSQFSAENLGATGATIEGTTTGDLSINVPTGAVPVNIPAVTETFNAAPFDGNAYYDGSSGKAFSPVASSSTPQTTALTSPGDLAAFTGFAQVPLSVSGRAVGAATSSNQDTSSSFQTQTSATITVIYHYIPNPPGSGSVGSISATGGGTSTPSGPSTGGNSSQGGVQAPSAQSGVSSIQGGHQVTPQVRHSSHRRAHLVHHAKPHHPLHAAHPQPKRAAQMAHHKAHHKG